MDVDSVVVVGVLLWVSTSLHVWSVGGANQCGCVLRGAARIQAGGWSRLLEIFPHHDDPAVEVGVAEAGYGFLDRRWVGVLDHPGAHAVQRDRERERGKKEGLTTL